MGKKAISARVDSKTKQDLKDLANERDTSISNMTAQLVRQSLYREETDGGYENEQLAIKIQEAEFVVVLTVIYAILVLSYNLPVVVTVLLGLLIIGITWIDIASVFNNE
jgi:predicted transcriptional regulator